MDQTSLGIARNARRKGLRKSDEHTLASARPSTWFHIHIQRDEALGEEMTTNEFGPNTPKVRLFIERLKVLSVEEVKGIAAWRASRDPRAWNPARNPARRAAWDTAWVAARDAALEAAWDTARGAARVAAWDAARLAAWDAAWDAARDAAWDAALDAAWVAARDAAWDETLNPARRAAWDAALDAAAIVVMDLITEEQFTTLAEPFAEILVELGIVWTAPALSEEGK
jgi:hypothetical protein